MDKFQAGFEILYICSGIDGEVDENEVKIIINFLECNEDNLEFEIDEVMADIDLLNREGIMSEFIYASKVYNETASASEKRILLDFIVKLIESDGVVDEDEMVLLKLLAEALNIDLEKYFN